MSVRGWPKTQGRVLNIHPLVVMVTVGAQTNGNAIYKAPPLESVMIMKDFKC